MRHATTSPLHVLVAALPDAALRPLLIELMQNGAVPKAKALSPAPAKPAPAKRPRGRPRGRPRKATDKDVKLAAQRQRDAENKRAARASARPAPVKTDTAKTNGTTKTNGTNKITTTTNGAAPTAAEVWAHAEKLSPGAAWKAFRQFEILDAVAVDAYRLHKLPPGFGPAEAARFLELPAG